MNVIERRKCTVLSRLDISLFVEGGVGWWRDKRKLPKAAPGRRVLGSKSDYDGKKKSFALRVLLSG